MKKLVIAIFALCLLEALGLFWQASWAFWIFRSAGATLWQAFAVAGDEYVHAFLVLLAGLLNWRIPRLRLPLAMAGLLGGFYAASLMIKNPNLLYSWDILHGELIATGTWIEAILIVIAVLSLAELALILRGAQ